MGGEDLIGARLCAARILTGRPCAPTIGVRPGRFRRRPSRTVEWRSPQQSMMLPSAVGYATSSSVQTNRPVAPPRGIGRCDVASPPSRPRSSLAPSPESNVLV
jgi:hypothetical protein